MRLFIVACLLSILGCGSEVAPREAQVTVGERIGDLTEVCVTERTHLDGALRWAYGVCSDASCSLLVWVYGNDDGMYIGESDPVHADSRCIRPGDSERWPSLDSRIGGRRVCMTEEITHSGEPATAYAVCADACTATCTSVVWVYASGGEYMGESGPVSAPPQCEP